MPLEITPLSEGSENSVGSILFGYLKKLADSVAVPLVVAALFSLGIARSEKLDDPSNWRAWLLILGVFAVVAGGGEAARRYYSRWRIRGASRDKIGVLLARLDNDKDNDARESVRDAIKKDLDDAVEILIWPEPLRLGEGNDADEEARAAATAQKWLKAKNCDLLLWGRVRRDQTVSLRFTPLIGTAQQPETYGFSSPLDIPGKFFSDLRSALAVRVVVSAVAAFKTRGGYIVPMLQRTAQRLGPIVAGVKPDDPPVVRGMLRYHYAVLRHTLAEQTDDRDEFEGAITAYRAALQDWTRDTLPGPWAVIQNALGNALQKLGEREADPAKLEQAIEAYNEALKEWTRDRAPQKWAALQNNIGNARRTLDERSNDSGAILQSVDRYEQALAAANRERDPMAWAAMQNDFGNALSAAAEREGGERSLIRAIEAFHNALEVRTRAAHPLDWAMTQNNLGNALRSLGKRRGNADIVKQSIEAFHQAREEWTRERNPLRWGMIQNNLGMALTALAEIEGGTAAQEAVEALRAALDVRTRQQAPLDWAQSQNNLGLALETLAAQQNNVASLKEAIAAYRGALEEWTKERAPRQWAWVQHNLGIALLTLDQTEPDISTLDAAALAQERALTVLVRRPSRSIGPPHRSTAAMRSCSRASARTMRGRSGKRSPATRRRCPTTRGPRTLRPSVRCTTASRGQLTR